MKAFIDTCIFYAAAYSKDPVNSKVKKIIRTLEQRSVLLYTSDYILDETYTLIRNRVGHAAAIGFMAQFKRSKIIVLRVTKEIEEIAEKIFIMYQDKDFSFTDCTSFAIIESFKIDQILSLDNHFRQFKYKSQPEFLP